MKKFFKTILWAIVFAGIIYFLYSSVVVVPRNNMIVVYSKFNNKLKVIKKPFNIIPEKGIPYNVIIKKYPLQTEHFEFIFKKQLTLLDKDIDLLKYKVIVKYNLDTNQYKYLFDHFTSAEEVNALIEEQFGLAFNMKVNNAIKSGYNLNTFPEKSGKDVEGILKREIKASAVNIVSLSIINIDIIPQLDYSRIEGLLDQSLKYEVKFNLDMRKIELEKIKRIKEAENEVEYLKIVGEYIEKNPLILKYIMINKIDKNDLIFIPSGEIGFDFANSLKANALKKFREK